MCFSLRTQSDLNDPPHSRRTNFSFGQSGIETRTTKTTRTTLTAKCRWRKLKTKCTVCAHKSALGKNGTHTLEFDRERYGKRSKSTHNENNNNNIISQQPQLKATKITAKSRTTQHRKMCVAFEQQNVCILRVCVTVWLCVGRDGTTKILLCFVIYRFSVCAPYDRQW